MLDWDRPGPKYAEMVTELANAMGVKKGEAKFPVIGRRTHNRQWREWYAYYGFRGMKWDQAFMRERDEKTVPTLSPFDFDAAFSMSREPPDVPFNGRDAPPTPEQRERARQIMDAARLGQPVRSTMAGGLRPFEIAANRLRAENAHLPVIKENVGHLEWLRMVNQRELPAGAKWVAGIGTVYGPPG